MFLLRAVLTFVLFSTTAWSAFLVARRLAAVQRPSLRVLTTATLFLAMQHAGFEVLTALHLFRPLAALVFWALLAVAVHATCGGRGGAHELERLATTATARVRQLLGSPVRAILLGWAAVVAAVRLGGGLVTPPLSWDSLTYHLFKPALWVHHGFQFRQIAPDQWRYTAYFPQAAEYPWAWAMLGAGSDAFLPFAGFLVWAFCGVAAYGLARSLGAKTVPAFYAGLVTAFIPAIQVEMVNGYADMFVLLVFLLAATALVEFDRTSSPARALLVGLPLGLLVAAKSSGFVVGGLGILGCLFIVLRSGQTMTRKLSGAGVTIAALLLMMAPGYARTWLETGSPFYPLLVKIGDHVLFEGNPELNMLYARKLTAGEKGAASLGTLFRALVIPFERPGHEYMGFGPGYVLLLPSAIVGLWVHLRRRRLRASVGTIVAMAVVPVLYLMSDSFAAQRAQWYIVMGRLIASLPALLAVLTARLDGKTPRLLLIVALLSGLWLDWPLGWATPTLRAVRDLVPTLLEATLLGLAAGLLVMSLSTRRSLAAWGSCSAAAVFLAVLAVPWSEVRAQYRYRIYEAAAGSNPAFTMHLVWDLHASAWPIWRHLDDGRPHRIAASYGWDGIGHNGLRYPLTGSHFQNEVVYVPITKTGEIIDYREQARVSREMDESQWLARLEAAKIEFVVLGTPSPPELKFVESNPSRFEPVAASADGAHRAYRFLAQDTR